MLERRQFSRLPIAISAELLWDGKSCSGLVHDISLCGLNLVASGTVLPPKDYHLDIHLHLPEDIEANELLLPGIVLRSSPNEVALAFDNANISLRKTIFLKTIIALCDNEGRDIDQELLLLLRRIEDQLWNQ